MRFTLHRLTDPLVSGATLGVLSLDGRPLFTTCELPWVNNEPNISCIPVGQHYAVIARNRRLPSGDLLAITLGIVNVTGRSGILIHPGNTPKDTRGCILIGKEFLRRADSPGIGASKIAMAEFVEILLTLDSTEMHPFEIK